MNIYIHIHTYSTPANNAHTYTFASDKYIIYTHIHKHMNICIHISIPADNEFVDDNAIRVIKLHHIVSN